MNFNITYRLTLLLLLGLIINSLAIAQPCTTLGQTPSSAFPVCGTAVFHQSTVPTCATNDLFVPGCSGSGNANYQNKNPFFYRFTCFTSGSLGFLIKPLGANEDYDWQLYDITGKNPEDIFTNNSLVVTGNWAGTYGNTGASASGVNFIQCASVPSDNAPTFAAMPNLVAGHTYLLMISHFTDTQSGYDLSFGGGTAVITDPQEPHLAEVTTGCDGLTIKVKLNRSVRCNSITSNGSEFVLSPNVSAITTATTDSCNLGFVFREITLTLATPLPAGTFDLVAVNGSDGNTLKDNCDRLIPENEKITFSYAPPQPIRADSIGKPKCAVDSVIVFYPKKIKCATITPSGSDFNVVGPTAVTVVSAYGGNCVNDLTDYVVVKFASPIYTKGNYNLIISPGVDGSPVFDLCGQPILPQTLPFITSDTVNADFTFTSVLGCQKNTLSFTHDGAHDVNNWQWTINGGPKISGQTTTQIFPATSSDTVSLMVSNGVCMDTSSQIIAYANKVTANFEMENIICPEDPLSVINTSTGQIDQWKWTYDVLGSSLAKDPPPYQFPIINREAYYTIKLVASNNALNCKDSIRKTLTVLDFCLIDVPTAFTPNNDGLNDTFWPHNALKADNLEFNVFNRWGQLMFSSATWRDKWDGSFKGVPQPAGVYVWLLSYTHRDTKQKVFKKGTVMLIR